MTTGAIKQMRPASEVLGRMRFADGTERRFATRPELAFVPNATPVTGRHARVALRKKPTVAPVQFDCAATPFETVDHLCAVPQGAAQSQSDTDTHVNALQVDPGSCLSLDQFRGFPNRDMCFEICVEFNELPQVTLMRFDSDNGKDTMSLTVDGRTLSLHRGGAMAEWTLPRRLAGPVWISLVWSAETNEANIVVNGVPLGVQALPDAHKLGRRGSIALVNVASQSSHVTLYHARLWRGEPTQAVIRAEHGRDIARDFNNPDLKAMWLPDPMCGGLDDLIADNDMDAVGRVRVSEELATHMNSEVSAPFLSVSTSLKSKAKAKINLPEGSIL